MQKFLFLIIIIITFLISIFSSFSSEFSFIFPSDIKYTSSEYGYREIFGKTSFHDGTDFPAPYKSNVYSSMSGTVIYVGFLYGYGNTVIISHKNGYKTSYSHLDSNFLVKVSDYVYSGQLIGQVGPKYLENGILNGFTTGPHLHFCIYKDGKTIDPMSILN